MVKHRWGTIMHKDTKEVKEEVSSSTCGSKAAVKTRLFSSRDVKFSNACSSKINCKVE